MQQPGILQLRSIACASEMNHNEGPPPRYTNSRNFTRTRTSMCFQIIRLLKTLARFSRFKNGARPHNTSKPILAKGQMMPSI